MLCFLLIRAGNNSNLTPMIGKLKEPRAQTHSVTYPYKYCAIVNNKYFACSHGGFKISIDLNCWVQILLANCSYGLFHYILSSKLKIFPIELILLNLLLIIKQYHKPGNAFIKACTASFLVLDFSSSLFGVSNSSRNFPPGHNASISLLRYSAQLSSVVMSSTPLWICLQFNTRKHWKLLSKQKYNFQKNSLEQGHLSVIMNSISNIWTPCFDNEKLLVSSNNIGGRVNLNLFA